MEFMWQNPNLLNEINVEKSKFIKRNLCEKSKFIKWNLCKKIQIY